MAETGGAAISMILSARSASFSRLVRSGVDAKTIRMFGGRRLRNSSCKKEPSVTPVGAAAACGAAAVLACNRLGPLR